MKRVETINVNFLTATAAQLEAAERKKLRLENNGYVLTGSGLTFMRYERG